MAAVLDPEKHKVATRDQWDRSARGCYDHHAHIRKWLRDATDSMLELADLLSGARVLDVAAGAGDEEAIVEGAARRIRPKLMTVATMMLGLLPLLWSSGTGADVMKRIAASMVGGLVTSFALELLVYPALFAFWKSRALDPAAAGDAR